jgi:hypothetical protein
MRTLIIVLALLFSTLASADTYWVKGDKVKDKNGTEYLIFNYEHKVQLGFKVDGLNLVPIDKSKNDSIRKEIKKKEEAKEKTKKEAKAKKLKNDLNNFINNLLKLSMTLLGILVIILSVCILSMLVWIGFYLYIKLKKL